MVKVNFNLRSTDEGKPSPVNLVLRWNNRRLVYSTGEAILPEHWCASTGQRNFQRAKESKAFPEHPEFNRRLDLLEHRVRDEFRRFQNEKARIPEVAEFREHLNRALDRDNCATPREFMTFAEHFIKKGEARIQSSGQRLARGTVRKYKSGLNALVEFSKTKNRALSFSGFDLDFYDQYTHFLTTKKGLAPNTVGVRIKTLKTILNAATEAGVNTNHAYRSAKFKAPAEVTDKIYLNEDELAELEGLNLKDNLRLDRVRDLFLVGAWTGLRFGDLSTITPANIHGDELSLRMAKTGGRVVIPLQPVVTRILKKYGGHLPPAPSNQKMNDYLKEVAFLAPSLRNLVAMTNTVGGERVRSTQPKWELVTTHTARRSFASNLYKRDMPARSIMAITGHTTERAFMSYIRLGAEEHAAILRKYMQPTVRLKAVS